MDSIKLDNGLYIHKTLKKDFILQFDTNEVALMDRGLVELPAHEMKEVYDVIKDFTLLMAKNIEEGKDDTDDMWLATDDRVPHPFTIYCIHKNKSNSVSVSITTKKGILTTYLELVNTKSVSHYKKLFEKIDKLIGDE